MHTRGEGFKNDSAARSPGLLLDLDGKAMTKTDVAYAAIRRAIEDEVFTPRMPLRTSMLQEQLNMSPTPIREALRLLQADGLVVHRSHHGMVVAEFSVDEVREIYRLRATLESLATELTAQRADDETIADIRRVQDAYAAATRSARQRKASDLNAEWHERIYEASGSRYLQEFIARLRSALPPRAMWMFTRAPGSVDEHEAVMRALETRDAKRAAEYMRKHIEAGGALHEQRLHDARGD